MPALPQAFPLLRRAALTLIVLLLLPLMGVRAARLARDTAAAAPKLWRTTAEERRLTTYGDCGGRGYGYLRRVMAGLPDPAIRPTPRYPVYDLHGDSLVPVSATRRDPRLVVGVDLADADLAPHAIAARLAGTIGGGSSWLFRTMKDYELMPGVRITRDAGDRADRIRVSIYDDARGSTLLRAAETTAPPSARVIEVALADPISPFSFARGGMDFRIDVTGAVASVEAIVALADLRGFTTVHRSGRCFTALRGDLLELTSRDPAWSAWLRSLQSR